MIRLLQSKSATNAFDEGLLLGSGGFGTVYKGERDGETTKVASKRRTPQPCQGIHELQIEIKMLSQLRHQYIISLIGYCKKKKRRDNFCI